MATLHRFLPALAFGITFIFSDCDAKQETPVMLKVNVLDSDSLAPIPGASVWCLDFKSDPAVQLMPDFGGKTGLDGVFTYTKFLPRDPQTDSGWARQKSPKSTNVDDIEPHLVVMAPGHRAKAVLLFARASMPMMPATPPNPYFPARPPVPQGRSMECVFAPEDEVTIRLEKSQSATFPYFGNVVPDDYLKVGEFTVGSPNLVITDPSYDLEATKIDGLGAHLQDAALGQWQVFYRAHRLPNYRFDTPDEILAVHVSPAKDEATRPNWQALPFDVGGDTALIGLYDLSHFHDDSLVPKNQKWENGKPAIPEKLWYSYNCDLIRDQDAVTVPYGCLLHWDGGVAVIVGRDQNKKIQAILLKAM